MVKGVGGGRSTTGCQTDQSREDHFQARPMMQIVNDTDPPQTAVRSGGPAGGMPHAAATGMAVAVDPAVQAVRLIVTITIVLSLAGSLCLGLIMTARQFTRTARLSRATVRTSASMPLRSERLQSEPERLRPVTGNAESSVQRERLLREIEAAVRQLDLPSLAAFRGRLLKLVESERERERAGGELDRSPPAPNAVP
jgi:hypothetical protein